MPADTRKLILDRFESSGLSGKCFADKLASTIRLLPLGCNSVAANVGSIPVSGANR